MLALAMVYLFGVEYLRGLACFTASCVDLQNRAI